MSNYEFMNFTKTPTEKHLGIATVRIDKKYIVRFKIVPNKDGNGFFPASASFKIIEDSADKYVPAFMMDSNYEKEELESFIKANVKASLQSSQAVVAQPDQVQMKYQDEEKFPF